MGKSRALFKTMKSNVSLWYLGRPGTWQIPIHRSSLVLQITSVPMCSSVQFADLSKWLLFSQGLFIFEGSTYIKQGWETYHQTFTDGNLAREEWSVSPGLLHLYLDIFTSELHFPLLSPGHTGCFIQPWGEPGMPFLPFQGVYRFHPESIARGQECTWSHCLAYGDLL